MADRVDYFFRQRVTEAELDQGDDGLEKADRDIMADAVGSGFLIDVVNPATVLENTPTANLFVKTNQFLGYDQLGRRASNLRSGFQGGVNLGAATPAQVVDLSVDEVAAATAVGTPGNEKTISIFIEFRRFGQDPRTDGNDAQIFFDSDESIQFNVVQSPEAGIGNSVPPALRLDQLLLADITLIFSQTQIVDANIDQTRRQAFTLKLTHGASHTETAADPVPNATPSEGGLESAADKTKLDGITFTAAGIGVLFNTQPRAINPANVVAPSAATLDVTGAFVAKTPNGSPVAEGVRTNAPENLVRMQRINGDEFLDAPDGQKVQARLTESGNVWTLAFFSVDEATGAENAFDMTPHSGAAIVFFVQEMFFLHNLPSVDPAWSVPSDQVAAEVPTATTAVLGLVLAGANGPATPLAGTINRVQNNGVDVAPAGPYDTVNYLGGGVSAAAGVLSIPSFGGPTGPTGPQGNQGTQGIQGVQGPTGPGFSSQATIINQISGATAFTTANLAFAFGFTVIYASMFFAIDVVGDDQIVINSVSGIGTSTINVNYTTSGNVQYDADIRLGVAAAG